MLKLEKKKKDIEYFRELNCREQAKLLLESQGLIKKKILEKLNSAEFKEIEKHLDIEEIAEILNEIPSKKREKFLKRLPKEKKEDLEFLFKLPEGSVGRFINMNFINIDINDSKEKITKKVKNFEKSKNKEPTILVYEDKFFLGEIPFYKLLMNESTRKSIKKLPKINYKEEFEDAIQLVKRQRRGKYVVIDDNEKILGILEAKDFLKHFDKELTRNFYQFAAVNTNENSYDSYWKKFKNRNFWLLINLITAFFSASIVSIFQDTISEVVLIAAFMPIVASIGGNSGLQTLAVIIRGITLNEIEGKTAYKVLGNEILSSGLNGIVIGLIVSSIALVLGQGIMFTIVIFISLIITIITAALLGTIIPLALDTLDIDPGTAASIFITACTDIIGFFTLLGLGRILLL